MTPASDTLPITRDALAELLARATARWLPLDDAAAYSGLSVVTLRRMIAAGKLRAHRPVKGKIVLDRIELDSVIASSTATPRTGRGRGDRKN